MLNFKCLIHILNIFIIVIEITRICKSGTDTRGGMGVMPPSPESQKD